MANVKQKSELLEHILELLSHHENISSRSMFGGYGIYKNKKIFAIIAYGELYFKVDNSNIDYFISIGDERFEYERGGKKIHISYYKAPAEIYDNPDLLNNLVDLSYKISAQKNILKNYD